MDVKIEEISELSNLLRNKNQISSDLSGLFHLFGAGRILRHYRLEKEKGISVYSLILALCLFRIRGESICMAWHKGFHGWFTAGKNSFYRLLCREKIHWRKLLLGVGKGFLRIVREQGGEGAGSPRCFILDDATFEKTGMHLEGISRVFDHVKHCCVLGYKCLILVFFDGKSSIPVDFSLHAEAGSKGTYGLSTKERSARFSKSRADGSPAKLRKSELGKSKIDVAIEMLKRAWRHGFRASCVLMDSWFTCKEMVSEIRRTGKGCLDCVGLVKAGNTKYKADGRMLAAQEIILRRERRQQKFCRKYKCDYITVNTFLGTTPVRLSLIRYGHQKKWHILLTTDLKMNFIQAFEIYQIRWNIEVLIKECKSYLNLGGCQAWDLDAQIADATLAFITYTTLALDKRFGEYETIGEIFNQRREDLFELTLWRRILPIIGKLLDALAEITGLTPEEMIEAMLENKDTAKAYAIIIDALAIEKDPGWMTA